MFCHITENWRGWPLISHEVVVNLIGHTTTNTSPFAQSTPHILNFKLPVEMSTQPQALQDCFLQP